MKTYPQIRRALAGKLWLVEPRKMEEILAVLELRLSGGLSAPEVLESIRAGNIEAAARTKANAGSGSIAVICVYGMIVHRQMFDMSGGSYGTSCASISQQLQAALADPGVGSIVMDFDSPGGDVDGVDELASEIYQGRKQKRITAVSNCLCASAAYYLASQCSEIVVSPSSLTGSIGVFTLHEDDSVALDAAGIKLELIKFGENKAEGNNLGPLSDSARAHLQEMVDTYGVAFEKAVARGRNVKQDLVHSKFGQGRVFDAKTAVKIGMADRVGTLAEVLGQTGSAKNQGSARAVDEPEIAATEVVHQVNIDARGASDPEAVAAAVRSTFAVDPSMVEVVESRTYTAEEIAANIAVVDAAMKAMQASRDRIPVPSAQVAREQVVNCKGGCGSLLWAEAHADYCQACEATAVHAGDGDADDCGCDCVPCDGGDCDGCDCDACECEGCACDSAVAKAKAKKAKAEEEAAAVRARDFDRMRHELSQAAAR